MRPSPSRVRLGLGPLRGRHGARRTDFMSRLIDDWIDRHTDNIFATKKALDDAARAAEQQLINVWAGGR